MHIIWCSVLNWEGLSQIKPGTNYSLYSQQKKETTGEHEEEIQLYLHVDSNLQRQ
jgi:hypothetical protein